MLRSGEAMTAKRGTSWKTSWNRKRGTPEVTPVNMAFFRTFSSTITPEAVYQTTGDSTLGATATFWFASVGVHFNQFARASPALGVQPTSALDNVAAVGFVSGTGFLAELPVSGDDFVCATLVTVTAVGAGARFAVHVDDQVSTFGTVATFTPATLELILDAASLPGAFHGFAGGEGVNPSLVEIRQWFKDLKRNLAIQEIPGKTTHLYSAAAVYPLVPGTLTNLGSDATQDLTLTTLSGTPSPTNVLLPVRFPY